jgi:intergrase/recombinase
MFNGAKRNNVMKALIILSKYLGKHQEFKSKLSQYGIKAQKQDAFSSFLRILNSNNTDLLNWYRQASAVVRPHEKLLLRFALLSGLRRSEAIYSHNLIVELSQNCKLGEYYNEEAMMLEHFKYKHLFLRGTKNTYITFIPKSVVIEIAESREITYPQIRKRLRKNGLSCRINELRDYFATFMVRHGLIREEVDLLQGRIPPSIFIRHYWSPSFKELRDRTLEALKQLEQTLSFR